jgi:hypothetical protein
MFVATEKMINFNRFNENISFFPVKLRDIISQKNLITKNASPLKKEHFFKERFRNNKLPNHHYFFYL